MKELTLRRLICIFFIVSLTISLFLGCAAGGGALIIENSGGMRLANTAVKEASVFDALQTGLANHRFALHLGKPFLYVFLGSFLLLSLLFAYICSNIAMNRKNRVGKEHGSGHIANAFDLWLFKKRFADKRNFNIRFTEHVKMSMDNRKSNRVTNTLIIGGTGCGKTLTYIKPNLLIDNVSHITTDPSGELFRSFAPYLISQGKNVYYFSVSDMANSNHYNPLLNVYDANGEISETAVDILVSLYIKNATNGKQQGSNDPFWEKAESLFLKALVYYVLECDEIPRADKSFATILKLVNEAKVPERGGDTELTQRIRKWQKRCEANGIDIKTPKYYDSFLTGAASEKTMATIVISTVVDLQIFATEDVARITSWNDKYPDMNIVLDTVGSYETYLFLSIPQAHEAYNFIIAMLYSQIYSRLYELGENKFYDKWVIGNTAEDSLTVPFDTKEDACDFKSTISERSIVELPYINGTKIYYIVWQNRIWRKCLSYDGAKKIVHCIANGVVHRISEKPQLPIRVEFMHDEFANVGEIPNFLKIITTERKYRMGSHVVIQNLAQLKQMYKDDSYQTIVANCDTLLWLGSTEPDDIKFLQEKLHKTTIRQRSTSGGSGGASYTPTEVEVLSRDDIEKIDRSPNIFNNKAVVKIKNMYPIVDNKTNITKTALYAAVKSAEKNIPIVLYFANNKEAQIIC